MNNNKLRKRLNGWRPSLRNRWYLIPFHVLTREEFLVYELCIDLAGWDKTHDDYACFEASDMQLASILGYKDGSSIYRYKRKLIEKGFLINHGDCYEVCLIDRSLGKGKSDGRAREIATEEQKLNPYEIVARLRESLAKNQNPVAQNKNQYATNQNKMVDLGSNEQSKALVSFSSKCLRTEEEYKQIVKEGGYQMLTIGDMKWIDRFDFKDE